MGTCDGDASAVEVCAEQVSQILSLLFSSFDISMYLGALLLPIPYFLLNLCDLHFPKTNVNSIVGFYKHVQRKLNAIFK